MLVQRSNVAERKNTVVLWDFENTFKNLKNLVYEILQQNTQNLPLPYIGLDYYGLMTKLRQDNLMFMIAAFPAYLYNIGEAKKIIQLMQQDRFYCITSDVDNATCKTVDGTDTVLINFGTNLINTITHHALQKVIIISDDVDFLDLGINALNNGIEDVIFMENYLMNKRIIGHKGIKCQKIPIQGEEKLKEINLRLPSNIEMEHISSV